MAIVIPNQLTIPSRQIGCRGNSNQREGEKPNPLRTLLSASDLWLCHSTCAQFRARISRLQHADASVDVGQANRQGESFTFTAFDRQLAAVLAHNPANNQKPEARAAGPGCEIGLEHATEIFRGNSVARLLESRDRLRFVHPGA